MLKTTIIDADAQHDYSELFSVISEIVGKAQFASILHLSPLVEAIKDLSASHRERKTCFNLICLLSHLVAQLKSEKFVLNEENDANGKQVKHLMGIARLLLLDGEEELGLNIIQIVLSILRMLRQDSLYATGWAYFSTFQLLNLTHLSNFALVPQFKTTLKHIHYTELLLRKRINQILASNRNSRYGEQITRYISLQH